MAPVEDVPLTSLPHDLMEDAARSVAEYSIGFLRVETAADGEDAALLGSGTLVSIGRTYAVLTADHVLSVLPRTGRMGLVLSDKVDQHTVDTQGLAFLRIARGPTAGAGPDLGALVLAPSIASTIAAKKTFYNLDLRREQMLQSPPGLLDGIWFVNGFVDEMTIVEPGRDGYGVVKGFYNLSGGGGPEEEPVIVGDHDYFTFPVSYQGMSVAPKRFGGMSGGGLWQVPLIRDTELRWRRQTPLLSGVVFYQGATVDQRCEIKCHARRSLYRVAYDLIQNDAES